VAQISIVGRNTQGVRLIRLDEGERLVSVEGIASLGHDAEEGATPADAIDAGPASGDGAGDPAADGVAPVH
jgi:DNA gyrase subunit A